MEDLLAIHVSLQGSCVAHAVLHRTLNFAKRRSLRVFHSLYWRFFLGLLPVNVGAGTYAQEWAVCTEKNMHEWDSMNALLGLRLSADGSAAACGEKKMRFDESDSSDDDDGSRVSENPLLPSAGSVYAFRYHVDAIRAVAQKDIDRLHWDLPFFEHRTTTETLCTIILNYCLRRGCEYRQGMHEIAAFILYLTHTDATLVDELKQPDNAVDASLIDTFKRICPIDGVAALSFFLFEALMGPSGMNLSHWYFVDETCPHDDIVAAARKVQEKCLLQLDPPLHHQMNVVYKIEGTSYLIRWLRLLFLREFSLDQCADLWDVFLSERFLARDSDYRLTDSIVTMLAASMLLFVKGELMVGCIDALKRVMKYPPVEDIGVLVARSIAEIDRGKTGIGRHFTFPAGFEVGEEKKLQISAQAHGQNTPTDASSAREIMNQQGIVLTSIINNLESWWFPSLSQSQHEEEEEDAVVTNYVLCIAELKRVRDVLLCRV